MTPPLLLQADCGDMEAAHKWHLKIFLRLVPHGPQMTSHLACRHLAQYTFSGVDDQDEPQPEPEPLRTCHCSDDDPQQQCEHEHSVHVQMPGLCRDEDEHGLLRVSGDTRSIEQVATCWSVAYAVVGLGV